MNNPYTHHHSSNVPQTKSGTKPSPSGVQPQNTPVIQLADQIVPAKAKPPLTEGEVQKAVEELEKVSRKHLQAADRRI